MMLFSTFTISIQGIFCIDSCKDFIFTKMGWKMILRIVYLKKNHKTIVIKRKHVLNVDSFFFFLKRI